MKKTSISFLIVLILINILSCGSDSSATVSIDGVVVQPTVILNQTITKKLPLQMWDWNGETRQVAVPKDNQLSNSSGDSIKPISCFIEGDGKELSINKEVEVIEEAICTWVLHQKNGFKKYNVGFKKIRIKSTGEEGWTFSTAVKIPD
tara:strand:- start:941 stop:1384 length:444 start_codon:yes stop_codon:yes gene_type:complete